MCIEVVWKPVGLRKKPTVSLRWREWLGRREGFLVLRPCTILYRRLPKQIWNPPNPCVFIPCHVYMVFHRICLKSFCYSLQWNQWNHLGSQAQILLVKRFRKLVQSQKSFQTPPVRIKTGFRQPLGLSISANFVRKFPAAIGNRLIWALAAFRNFFVIALAAFSKISINEKVFSQLQLKFIFFRNYYVKIHEQSC